MDNALYGCDGFYTQGGRPGLHHGDFGTSPERGQLFARCLANYLDKTWHELGEPSRFLVIEAGAGTGTLCQAVLEAVAMPEASLECVSSLCYMLIERSEKLRSVALERLAPLSTQTGVPITVAADLPAAMYWHTQHWHTHSAAPNSTDWSGVIVANELLDNMAVRIVERSDDPTGWQELYLTPAVQRASARFPGVAELLQPAPAIAAAMANKLYLEAKPGTRLPLHTQASVWIRRAQRLLSTAQQARLLIFDYGTATTAELADRTMAGWLRTYADHRLNPTEAHIQTTFDITCDVGFDQLPSGYTLTTQSDWLATNGIHQLTDPAKQRWQSQLTNPTSEVLADRALLDEADDLTNPAVLGSFLVAQWRGGKHV